MKMTIQELNAYKNRLAREVRHLIGSPARIDEYIELRLRGVPHDKALAQTRNQKR